MTQLKGKVFDIQRFSTHDGPGIRTIVFLKGCPLCCTWCSNPESQASEIDILFSADKCIGCKKCEEACPVHIAAGMQGIDKRCIKCGACVKVCPSKALEIKGKVMGIGEIMEEVDRDVSFYRHSGGGVTISGGEPLMQPEFAAELAEAVKKHGHHLAIETTGYAPWESVKKVFDKVDLILYDVKSMDAKIHKDYTGVSNELILDNLFKAAQHGYNITVRVPLIEGVNASEENFRKLAEFMNKANIRNIDLLPYHTFGESKYKQLRTEYSFSGTKPQKEKIEMLINILEEYHLNVTVGG